MVVGTTVVVVGTTVVVVGTTVVVVGAIVVVVEVVGGAMSAFCAAIHANVLRASDPFVVPFRVHKVSVA